MLYSRLKNKKQLGESKLLKYRAEIDGLRAIAVLSVIFFHMKLDPFQGGFVGVDIFFVISGYLITSLIIEDIKQKQFSLLAFYERRVRRILPALLVVLVTVYAFSWFYSLAVEHKSIAQYVVASLLFSSNILLFLQNQDYFQLAPEENPLLHTWSLAVEEQYYILFPLLIVSLWKFKKTLLAVLIFTLLASLSWAAWQVEQQPIAAFYLLPARLWEILAGAFCAFYLQSRPLNYSSLGGLAALLGAVLILVAIFMFNNHTPTPSLYTLLPIVGTVLIILFAAQGSFIHSLLSTQWLVSTGLLSYSIYLWHQPLLVYGVELFGEFNVFEKLFLLTPLIFLFAYLTWFGIERYFRNRRLVSIRKLVVSLAPICIALMALGFLGHINNGFENRNLTFQKLAQNSGFGMQCNGNYQYNDSCASSKAPKVIALGNSYMMHLVSSLPQKYSKEGVLQLTQEGCEIAFIENQPGREIGLCSKFYQQAIQTIKNLKETQLVVMSSPFNGVLDKDYRSSLIGILKDLSQQGRAVVLIGPTPDAPFNVGKCLAKKHALTWLADQQANTCDFSVSSRHLQKVAALEEIASSSSLVKFVDLTTVICPAGRCQMERDNGLLMYIDQGHLSVEGANYVLSKIAQELPVVQQSHSF